MRRQRTAATMAICLTLLLTGTAQAARESWYSYWGVGYANNSYYSELESTINAARGMPRTTISLSAATFLGFPGLCPTHRKHL